jgi:hypothetical protein
MNRLSTAKRAQIVSMMSEGNSLRAITRMTGASINTVTKLLVDLGNACAEYHDEHVRNVTTKRIEADEVWTFCYARRDNVPDDKRGLLGFGDVWTWVGLDADSKLVVSWTCGRRDADTAYEFMHDLKARLSNRVQLGEDRTRRGCHAWYDRATGECARVPDCRFIPAQIAVALGRSGSVCKKSRKAALDCARRRPKSERKTQGTGAARWPK